MKSSMMKRLDAVEGNLGEGLFVVIVKGLPPYRVMEHHPGSRGQKGKPPILIDTLEELEAYVDSLPRSAKVVEIVDEEGEPPFPSIEYYRWGC